MFLTIVFLAASAQVLSSPPQPICIEHRADILKLAPEQFDQDLHGGWRTVAAIPGCFDDAADLIAEYRRDRWHVLEPAQANNLYWHEGQLRAYLGQTQRAIGLMMAGVTPSPTDFSFQEYALGTIAFLQRDRAALESARTRLAALPQTPEFAAEAEEVKKNFGITLRWPKNLDVLDRLLACFDLSYQKAYAGCPGPQQRK